MSAWRYRRPFEVKATLSPLLGTSLDLNFTTGLKRAMSEAEYFVWDSLFSSGKKKRKKKSRPSSLYTLTQQTKDDAPKKKKKNAKYKKAMDERKAKRKEKKKKNKEKLSKLHDSLVNDCKDRSESIEHLTSEYTAQDTKKKRKKRVAFDLPHSYEKVKRPKLSSSPHFRPFGCPSSISAGEEDAALIVPSQIQDKTNDSQSTSDDMQSQDLFITQKTFRLPLSQMSSEEASDRAEDNAKGMEMYVRETQEECVLFKTQKVKKELCREKAKISPSNLFLEEPIVVTSSLDEEKKTKDRTTTAPLSHHAQERKAWTTSCTQTENFFTTELSMYLKFCKKSKSKAQSNDSPLDLSLPHRARRNLSATSKYQHEETNQKDHITEVGDEGSDLLTLCGQGKEERTPSTQSESDSKSADTTVSSEDLEVPSRTTRLEVMQIRAVQMRLNESFFFKAKGEGPSPRPQSPLMKLVQGREPKSHKKN